MLAPLAFRLVLAATLMLAAVAPAQATLFVGPGSFPDVNAALAAASPGDTIRVLPGTYPTFQMQKGVTIRADLPGTVAFAGLFPCLVAVPTGQHGHLFGLDFGVVALTGGHASFDDCTIVGAAMAITNGAVVVMQGCTVQSLPQLTSGNSAIRAMQSELSLIDCTVLGSGLGPLGGTLQPAIALVGSRLRGSNLQVQAGAGGGGFAGAPAIAGDAASSLWLSDSTASADPNVCPLAVANGRHDRSTLTPNCSSTPSGFVLGVHRVQPVQPGAVFAVDFVAQPGMAVGLFAAYSFASQGLAELEQSLLLPANWFALGTHVTDAQGVVAAAWPIPTGPAITGQTVWVQGFTGFAFPLQASPLVGGVAR